MLRPMMFNLLEDRLLKILNDLNMQFLVIQYSHLNLYFRMRNHIGVSFIETRPLKMLLYYMVLLVEVPLVP